MNIGFNIWEKGVYFKEKYNGCFYHFVESYR